MDLVSIPPSRFSGRTITTGATSSNILGLALGRQFVISHILGRPYSVAEDGFGGVEIDILTVEAHASIRKAAALVGIGRSRVLEMGYREEESGAELMAFDLRKLELALKHAKENKRGVIVCPSYGEVNTVSERSKEDSKGFERGE